ncbi:WYL domain-containing protein [Mediterraneibacter gnavus]
MITNVRSSYEDREIEPYYLIFKWSSWYVWGWCKKRKS